MPTSRATLGPLLKPLMLFRMGFAGMLMGLANLVPGVSGGTMILVMGLYDEFVSSVASVTRLRFPKRSVFFLAVVIGVAGIAIVALAGPTHKLVSTQQSAMYSLFIGLTLGGAPLLYRMFSPIRFSSFLMVIVGLLVMITIALIRPEPSDKAELKTRIEQGELEIQANYGIDVLAGVLGVSAMVLPGISGAYMLLILGRYETILASIAAAKSYLVPSGRAGDTAGFHVIIPVAIGVIIGLVVVSNLLKWLLLRYKKPTLSFLMGILLGSVIGIWPFDADTTAAGYGLGVGLALLGFAITFSLSRLSRKSAI